METHRSAPADDYAGSYTVLLQPGAPAVGNSLYPQVCRLRFHQD